MDENNTIDNTEETETVTAVENLSVTPILIEKSMEDSYLRYAMSVIVARALPDVRDGLKPVHRRILYAMKVLGNEWNRPYKKSARIVGDVIGKYHPHGDSAVYETMVRMAQDFSLRVPLVDGQGNFGSMDGDSPAAMRYTESRMKKVSQQLLLDLDKDTVDFRPNYDESELEPTVLPARFPNLLVNGSSGIAVGMATNIPPHNLGETIDASLHLVDNPEATILDLMQFVKAPDFPTGGLILNADRLETIYETGRGSILMRAATHFEETPEGRNAIIIDQMPYQVNKANLFIKIAEQVKNGDIEGIVDLRDESDRSGVRGVIELKRDALPEVVLNMLFKHTSLQTSFPFNMLAIENNRPRRMGLKDILVAFLRHREEVITRRTKFDLRKARTRAHLLAGLATAVDNIDEVIKIVRGAPDSATAKVNLLAREWNVGAVKTLIELLGEKLSANGTYKMSEAQAQAILDMRLHRLTGLEQEKIQVEAQEIAEHIKYLVSILANRDILLGILKDELVEVKEQFADPRRSIITEYGGDLSIEDLIKPEEMVVTISTDGYVKRQPLDSYRAQRRGGKGKSMAKMKNDEQLETLFVANTHEPLLFFTTEGKVHQRKVYELPMGSSNARGKALINFLNIEKTEKVMRVLSVPKDKETWKDYVAMFATKLGIIRKTPLTAFNNVNISGIKGCSLNEGDILLDVCVTPENQGDVIMSTRNGSINRFQVADLRPIASRTATGVRGITLREGDELASMRVITAEHPYILTITENGFGKRTDQAAFTAKSRGTKGVMAIRVNERNGCVIASLPVEEEDQIMVVTSDGQVIRTRVSDISVIGRSTQGVTIFKTDGKTKALNCIAIPANLFNGEDEEGDSEILDENGEVISTETVALAEISEEVEADMEAIEETEVSENEE
ncbi:MAG: DNA gyrase subunit A [Proteobacteria bacterium]|nr:DNA gyrase subunit A [Pseudomonadota bacterium]